MGSRDYISNLPDEILGKILSLLPTHQAASTLVLSKRWRNLFALVDNLDFNDASGGPFGFCDFVDKSLARLSNTTTTQKRFSLTFASDPDDSRVNSWTRTVLERGCLELHLENVGLDRIETEFFTSTKLVKLILCDGFFLDVPRWTDIFPALKTLSLIRVDFEKVEMYEYFISGCPALEDLLLQYRIDYDSSPTWSGAVSSPSLKRLTILYINPHYPEAHYWCRFETPNLVYLDYSSYAADKYEVDLASLVEARLDVRSWDRLKDTNGYGGTDDDDDDDDGYVLYDATGLVEGISNVKWLHLSPDSLEIFHFCCKSMPVFHNLLTLSFESDEEKGWQVVPLLLSNSPILETLIIKGLVHKVTNRCGNACPCSPKKKTKMKEEARCLSTCQVKVLNISAYQGTSRELKQMRHFLANLKCLEYVKVGVKVNHQDDHNDVDNKYLGIINALLNLPKVSSNCQIQFF